MVQEIVRKEIQEYCAANLPAMIRTELEKIMKSVLSKEMSMMKFKAKVVLVNFIIQINLAEVNPSLLLVLVGNQSLFSGSF